MPAHLNYTPVLKTKLGELGALKALAPDTWNTLTPLFEITPPTFDYVAGEYAKSPEAHLQSVIEKLADAITGHPRCFIALPDQFPVGEPGTAVAATDGAGFLGALMDAGVQPMPVLRPEYSDSFTRQVLDSAQHGVALRGTLADFDVDDERTMQWLNNITSARDLDHHLILDLESVIDSTQLSVQQWRRLVVGALEDLQAETRFASTTVLASSFPRDLSEVDAGTSPELPRIEWEIWNAIVDRSGDNAIPRFGDYTISHPRLVEIDPRQMRMSANIRYTTEETWLLVKGRNVRDHGFDQFGELCRTLVAHPKFSGQDFSWGDKFIADCASGTAGPGNATTWRKVGVNHHITLVARQLASRGD